MKKSNKAAPTAVDGKEGKGDQGSEDGSSSEEDINASLDALRVGDGLSQKERFVEEEALS